MSIDTAYQYPDFQTWYKDNQNYDDEFIKDDPTNYNFTHKLDVILSKTHGYVAGGCFKNLVKGEDPKDIDVYYEDKMDMEDSIKRVDEDKDFKNLYHNENVHAYIYKDTRVELVTKYNMSPLELLERFDFTVTKFAYVPYDTSYVIFHQFFFRDLQLKHLVVNSFLQFPLSTWNRVFRYAKYGYQPCRETRLYLAHAINSLDASNLSDENFDKDFYEGFD